MIQTKCHNKSLSYSDFAINQITLIRALLGDAIFVFLGVCGTYLWNLQRIWESYSDEIEARGILNCKLVKGIEEDGLSSILEDNLKIDIGDHLQMCKNLVIDCYPGYQGGNKYLGSLISKVQFKYIMDTILLEEIPEYTADNCKGKALFCNVCDRSGWYEFKTIDLTEDIDYYNFNPQYSSTIYISLPTEDGKKLIISGLYHWELKLLSLDLHDEKNSTLMINSPERESFNEKDILEMDRYLQALNNTSKCTI